MDVKNRDARAAAQPAHYEDCAVLVIEDEAFVRLTIAFILRQMGFRRVYEADNGASGLEAYAREKPHIIVCDIEMEPVDGLDFLATLRQRESDQRQRVPVIFLTNHTQSALLERAMNLGVDAFVVKPPSYTALKDRIDRILSPGR